MIYIYYSIIIIITAVEMNSYITHNNGGSPYLVIVYDEEKKVEIYDNDGDKSLLYSYNFINIFIGHDSERDNDGTIGNSILAEIYDCRYLFIGHNISEFSTNEKILEYVSDIGNSDVPYPYAVSEKNIYLMLELVYFSKELCDTYECYDFYYHQYKGTKKIGEKKIKCWVIHSK